MDRVRLPSLERGMTGAGILASSPYGVSTMPTYTSLVPARYRETGFASASPTKADEFLARYMGASFGDAMTGGTGADFTNVGALAGGALADARDEINAAARRNGIPPNLLAAVIARESTGNWARDGSRYTYLPDRGYNILPYTGMTDPAIRRVGMDPYALIGDRAGQIEAAARLLKAISQEEAAGYGWQGVANVYYSGDPTGQSTPGDSWQYGTTQQYGNDILKFWNMLEPGGPSAVGAAAGAGSGGSFSLMFGGAKPPVTQGMGMTPFAIGKTFGGGMYSYSSNYGVEGHAGVDYGMAPGQTLYAPVGGTVVYAGGTGYYTDERYGNTPGTGEFRLKLDNGDELILGHMQQISVRPGQRINAGDVVGLSGTSNGGHVHVEYRQVAPGQTASGYKVIDPEQALGALGATTTSMSGSPLINDIKARSTRGLGQDLGAIMGWS